MDNPTRPADEIGRDAPLVVVLKTGEAGLLPLVRIALEQEGIEYTVRNRGLSEFIIGTRTTSTVGNSTPPFEVLVFPKDADRARELLVDLETARVGPASPPQRQAAPAPMDQDGVELFDAESGVSIGRLDREAFESVAEHLELESDDDNDYFIDEATLAMLEEGGADAGAVALLRRALGTRPGMDVRWNSA